MSGWQEQYEDTLWIFRERQWARYELILVGHALLECFSTMTGFLVPSRVDARDAAAVGWFLTL